MARGKACDRHRPVTTMAAQAGLILVVMSSLLGMSSGQDIVHTDKGDVRGFTETLPDNKVVNTFLGIPFAAPPVNELRFRHPRHLDRWEGVLNATELPNSCIQPLDKTFGNFTGSNMWNANTRRSEDCLYLNLWSPNNLTGNKSVIVWIYGGAFYSGSSTLEIYDGKYLAAETDVVVVSVQYRVGSLGFLALNTEEAPGNAGLLDQRMALEWVNRNILQFGGNPQSVTLMGESAGAASVGLFLTCDILRGYLHKAILQSGSPSSGWGAVPKEEMWRRSTKLAELLECHNKDENQNAKHVVHCLRNVEPEKFQEHEFHHEIVEGIMQFPFVPIIDGLIIVHDPKEMLRRGLFKKIPLLLGSNENEGTFFEIYSNTTLFRRDKESIELSPEAYDYMMDKTMFHYYPTFPKKMSALAQETVKFHYRNWQRPQDGVENMKSLDRAVSDAYFVCPVNELALAYTRMDAPVYYYWFNQRWSANPWPEWMGVLHGDEIWFTFGHPVYNDYSFTVAEKDLSRKMMHYWANFAKTGDPNKGSNGTNMNEWPVFESDSQRYLTLSDKSVTEGPQVGQWPRTEHCVFWKDFLPRVIEDSDRLISYETVWQNKFQTWKHRYIEGWNDQINTFLTGYKKMTRKCIEEP